MAKLTLQLNEAFPGQIFKIQPLGESRQLQHLWSKIQEAQNWVVKISSNKSAGASSSSNIVTLRPHCLSCNKRTVPALEYWQDEYRSWVQDALDFTNHYAESSGAGRVSALSDNWLCGCAGGHVTWHYVVVFNSYEATVACVQRF